MNRALFLSVLVFSIISMTVYTFLPHVEAKPFIDEGTGIGLQCNWTNFSAFCQIVDPKNGVFHVSVENNDNHNFDQDVNCDKRIETPKYDPIFSNGIWRIIVSNCNGETSVFTLELINGDFTLIGINQI